MQVGVFRPRRNLREGLKTLAYIRSKGLRLRWSVSPMNMSPESIVGVVRERPPQTAGSGELTAYLRYYGVA